MHVCVPSDRRCSLMKDIVRLIDAVHKLNTVQLLAEWKITYDTLVKLSVQNRRTRDRRKALTQCLCLKTLASHLLLRRVLGEGLRAGCRPLQHAELLSLDPILLRPQSETAVPVSRERLASATLACVTRFDG